MTATPVVTLLTDYGTGSEFPGICHGVIRRICRDAAIVDITHAIARHDVRQGALVLRNALPFMPVGVHVAVVDPQVGTERRAVAVRCADERVLVGPDNGLLSLAWEQAGGAAEAVDVSRSPHRLEPISATFHGRDVFAPVGAALAGGAPFAGAGDPLDAGDLVGLELPRPRRVGDVVIAHVLLVDVYGNVTLDVRHEDLPTSGLVYGRRLEVSVGGRSRQATFTGTFADVAHGEVLVYEDSTRLLALAVNRGSAADTFELEPDAEVRLTPL
ncbi:MAG: S-adenosyl-l-methionine hydroxide adenosyltransferase family protein [Thermoleophilaceae bacterium]